MRKNLTNAGIIGCAVRGENAMTTTGNMSTDHFEIGHSRFTPYCGHLSEAWASVLSDGFAGGHVSQVIYSYSTPIAWHDARYGWVIPIARYSATTSSKHQSQLYMLPGRHILIPWDATADDAQRVMERKMYFANDGRGRATRTFPGPNYVEGE